MLNKEKSSDNIPEETYRVARAIHAKGNLIMQIRDELEGVFTNEMFANMYPSKGRPSLSPQRLILALILQYISGYTDRQTSAAIRENITWKYALGLELDDTGFDHSVLSEFRDRLIQHEAVDSVFDAILKRLSEKGFLKGKKKQRTDATHILASVRNMNRIEFVGETMRMTLTRIAQVDSIWLGEMISQDWVDRYSQRFNDWHLPKTDNERLELAHQIGADGYNLLERIYEKDCPEHIRIIPEIEIMRQIWVQQFWCEETQVKLRDVKDTPKGANLIKSPFDIEARFTMEDKRKKWLGYKTHFTETCSLDAPRIVTQVTTCCATQGDRTATNSIQKSLCKKGLKPQEHYLDTGYASARTLVGGQAEGIEMITPVQADASWQAKREDAFDIQMFFIDWKNKQAICPCGSASRTWSISHNQTGEDVVHIHFSKKICQACPVKERCTKGQFRTLQILQQPLYEALVAARTQQETDEFKEKYRIRSGIEGTFSAAIRSSGLRKTPFIGLQKTHLHCAFSAIALNLKRAINWLNDVPIATTRKSPLKQFAAAG